MNRKAAHMESTINEIRFHLRGDALTKFKNISNSDDPPMNYEQLKVALEWAFPNQWGALFHTQKATFVEQDILRDEANVVFSPWTRYNVGLQESILALQPSGRSLLSIMFDEPETLDYDDLPTLTPKLGMGCTASQSPDGGPPRMPWSFCSEDD
uniref:Uncharacterized protein n=1 Tax=Romanomermis culicivorax TaxID=13658 RepID=A0A915HPZ9_ROMCU